MPAATLRMALPGLQRRDIEALAALLDRIDIAELGAPDVARARVALRGQLCEEHGGHVRLPLGWHCGRCGWSPRRAER
jgi:hypothetical protein